LTTSARFWVPGDVPQAVAAYLRAILVRTVEAGEHGDVWPLLSMLYGLAEAQPDEFTEVRARAESDPALAVRVYTDWARRQASATDFAELAVVFPDPERAAEWLRQRVRRHKEYDSIYTEDQETLFVLAQAADIAIAAAHMRLASPNRLQLPVVLLGESGTGKELLAKAMHQIHMRALSAARGELIKPGHKFDDAFGPINCGGLPAKLVETELFGHIEGAFTGATGERDGLIPTCASGTVFLDEIGDTPPKVQLRLLRFMNDGEIRRVGSDKPEHHYPWVIAATHRDLAAYVAEGKFRDDLFHRLNGYFLHLKPLKDRGDDAIGALNACIRRHAGRALTIKLSVAAERALRDFGWKGNLRVVDQFARRIVQDRQPRAAHLSLDVSDLPFEIVAKYLESRTYGEILADQYAEERKTLSDDDRIAMRESLVRHYANSLAEMVPEVRFARSMCRLGASAVVLKLFDDPKEHRKLVRALEALADRIARQHLHRFRDKLYAIDQQEVPQEESPAELVEPSPSWVRKLIVIVEHVAGNPSVSTPLRNFESLLEKVPAPVRELVMDLLATLAEEARTADFDFDGDAVVVGRGAEPHWKDVKKDKELFYEQLRKAGSMAELARRFRVDHSTVAKVKRGFEQEKPKGSSEERSKKPAKAPRRPS